VRRRRTDRLPPREAICVPPSLRVALVSYPRQAKKTGREGQQRRLRDESASARTPARGILAGAGTHVAQKLPGLAIVLDDAGIGFRGGSGHRDCGSFREVTEATEGEEADQGRAELGSQKIARLIPSRPP
jgi:hypothetical protein